MSTYPAVRLGKLDDQGRRIVFTDARTTKTFADMQVSDDELRDIWELTRWMPTASNTQPMRVVFVRTEEGKARLLPHMWEGNQAKTASAPAVAIVAYDNRWHDQIPTVMPARPEMKDRFEDESVRHGAGRFSAALQAGGFILAIRAAGLAAGPMAGFDGPGLDAEFFADGNWTTLMVVNIGHPGENAWAERLPRVAADVAVAWA